MFPLISFIPYFESIWLLYLVVVKRSKEWVGSTLQQ
jgi:hypothetical protein